MQSLTTIHTEFLVFTREQLLALSPYIWVFGGCILAIFASVIRSVNPKWSVFSITLLTCISGIWSSINLMPHDSMVLFNGMMVSDSFSNFLNVVFLASAGLTCCASLRYLDRENLQHPEYYVLVLFSALGMMLMASAL